MGSFLGIYIIVGFRIMRVFLSVEEIVAIQDDEVEVAQIDDEIHIFVLGGLDKGCHTLFAIGDIGCMEVGSNGKPDGPFRDPLVGATCGQECQAKWVFRPIPFSGTSNTFLPCSKASFTCLS